MLVNPGLGLRPAYGLEWDERRRQYRAKHPKVCAACGDKRGCQLHHKRYTALVAIPERPGYGRSGNERNRDLVWLCDPGCHERVHHWHDKLFPRDRLPYRWLAFVTVGFILLRRLARWIRPAPCLVAGMAFGWWAGAIVWAVIALVVGALTWRAITTHLTQPGG